VELCEQRGGEDHINRRCGPVEIFPEQISSQGRGRQGLHGTMYTGWALYLLGIGKWASGRWSGCLLAVRGMQPHLRHKQSATSIPSTCQPQMQSRLFAARPPSLSNRPSRQSICLLMFGVSQFTLAFAFLGHPRLSFALVNDDHPSIPWASLPQHTPHLIAFVL